MREKLIELLTTGMRRCWDGECTECEYDDIDPICQSKLIANYLIDKGVTIPVRCGECACSERYAESRNLYECKVDKMIMRKNDYCSSGIPKEKGEE